MSFPGAAEPPPGVTPNIDNPEDVLRTCNYVTQGLTMLLVTAFIATRFYAKNKVLGGGFSFDDLATYLSYLFMIGYIVTAVVASTHGGGLNIWEVRKEEIEPFFQSGYAATLFYAPMALGTKLALLSIIIRVFGGVHKKTLIGVYVFIAALVIYYVSGWFIKLFICWPISAYWRGDKSKCLDQRAIIIADATISVISDLVILLLPTPLTWSLQLPKRKRLRVMGLLCAGGVATAFSIYRLAMILEEGNSRNQSIVFTKVLLSGNAEVGIGLICACLPAVNALFVRRGRGSSYIKQQSQSTRGEIMLTRSFHIDTTRGGKNMDDETDAGHDEAALVSDIRAGPSSVPSSRRSNSIC